MAIDVKCYPKGLLDENTYLITDKDTGYQAIVDPGYFGEDIAADITESDNLKYIILTHAHYDHYSEAADYINNYDKANFVVPAPEKYLLSKVEDPAFASIGMRVNGCAKGDIEVGEDDSLELGNSTITFIETPGHTEGSICVRIGNIIFSGDTLFRASVGNTNFETGNWSNLKESIRNKLFVLDADTLVYPGHGPVTTIGYEKEFNPFV